MKKLKKKKNNKAYFNFDKTRRVQFLSHESLTKSDLVPSKVKKISAPHLLQILYLIFVFLLPTQLGKHFFPPYSYLNGVRVDYLSPTIYLTDILVFLLLVSNFKRVMSFFKNKKLIAACHYTNINICQLS